MWSKIKKYLVVFHLHKINCLHVYYWSAVLYLVYFFLSLCKTKYLGTLVNISFIMFWNFLSVICVFLKALRTWCVSYFLWMSGRLVRDFVFFWFSQRVFSLQHFWTWTSKLFLRVAKPKCVNKSFDVIIPKYILHV